MDDQIITVESSQSLDSIILHNSNDKDVKCLDDCVHLNTIKSSSINITYDEGELSTTASLSSSPSLNPTRHELNTSKPLNDSNYSLINSFKKRIKQHLTLSRNSSLYKSMHDLSISPKKFNYPSSSSSSTTTTTPNSNIVTFNSSSSSISSTNVNKLNLTQDVPDDITSIQNEHENALNTVTSFTNEQLLLLQTSWSIVKQHIEKIGVITFLGIFEQHSDFRDAFTEFRKRKFVDIKHDPAMQVHGLRVLSVVDKLITRLPKTDDIEKQLMMIGSKHCRYVPTIALVSSVSDQLWGAIEPVLKEEGLWSADLAVTWKSILDYLTRTVKYGLAKTFHSTHK
ncbi:unnamed protein product [Schistosoma rodhaini]|uniref:GLOBIN domain-containing protein n=1 Tax=Schistosoma mansoni TaxID=6183 RepID=A0A5K4FCW5_SCHMA|nr:unnamed protein product [Schistosoma rodhaini]